MAKDSNLEIWLFHNSADNRLCPNNVNYDSLKRYKYEIKIKCINKFIFPIKCNYFVHNLFIRLLIYFLLSLYSPTPIL